VVPKRILIVSVFLISIIFILSSFVSAGLNAVSEASTPQLKVTLQSQSPDPVEPGQVLTVKFKIENEGKETSSDVIVKLKPGFPFSLHGDVAEKNIGKLRASSTGADAVIVSYKLKVNSGAVEKDTELELDIISGGGVISYNDDEFLIDIQTHDAVLDITSIKAEPSQVAPGETAQVHITIKNLADSLLKDIKFDLDFSGSGLPLAPYQSSSERRIAQLDSGFQNSLTFTIIASPDASPGLYKIPLVIDYKDEKANSFNESDLLAITIGDSPKLRPFIKKSTVLKSASPGKLTIGLANAGTNNLKFVELFILPSDDYELISTSDYFYIGDIDSDDTESEELDIYINKKVEELNVPVKLKYNDANNKPFQQEFDLKMNVYSSSQLVKFGIIEGSKIGFYIVIILLIFAGYFYYKRYYKNSEKSLWNDLGHLFQNIFYRKKK